MIDAETLDDNERSHRQVDGWAALLGDGYVESLWAAFGARRFVQRPSTTEATRRLALADIVDEIPELAVQAYDGCALSDDPIQRRSAALLLGFLSADFPEDAERIARSPSTDDHERTSQLSRDSFTGPDHLTDTEQVDRE